MRASDATQVYSAQPKMENSLTTQIDYIAIDDALRRMNSDTEAAESHGILCGMLCAAGPADFNSWLQQLMNEVELNTSDVLAREAIEQFEQLYKNTIEQLNDTEMGFQLFLPEDEDSNLLNNVRALSEWCQGFLLGFSLGASRPEDSLPKEVKELLTDFVEITKVDMDDASEDDQDQESFMEVMEYVRMGVLLMQELLHPIRGPSTLQ